MQNPCDGVLGHGRRHPEGFVTKTYAAILADIEAAQKGLLGNDLDVSPEQPLGQINGIMSAALRELWEPGAAVYASRDPDGTTDQSLSRLTPLTGTTRRGINWGRCPSW